MKSGKAYDGMIGKRVEVSMADGFGLLAGTLEKDGEVYRVVNIDVANIRPKESLEKGYEIKPGDDVSLSMIQYGQKIDDLPDIFKAVMKLK